MTTRNTDQTITSILCAAVDGITKTKIMYKAFITYDQLNDYLSLLVEKGMIEYTEGERLYRTTPKGVDFLNHSESPKPKILVVGLGQLGLPVARYVKEKGFDDVYGYDISPKAMERAEKIAGIKKANDLSDFDVYILCVSTHKPDDMFTPQIEGLLSIVERISKEARRDGALVSIESTIPRGTSARVFEMLNHRLHVAHAPHRWYALEEKEHGVNQLRVVGGVCDCCLQTAMQFYNGSSLTPVDSNGGNGDGNNGHADGNDAYVDNISRDKRSFKNAGSKSSTRRTLGIPMHPVSKIEIAELSKIAENAHRYLQIAFAEDLYLYCQENNLNFSELRDALNTKWNVNILEPREGIGGHCLPKDTRMFLQSSKSIKSKILTAAIEVDQDYRQYRQIRASKSMLSHSVSPPLSASNLEEDDVSDGGSSNYSG